MIKETHLQQVADLLFGQFSGSFGDQSFHLLSLHLNTHTQIKKRKPSQISQRCPMFPLSSGQMYSSDVGDEGLFLTL